MKLLPSAFLLRHVDVWWTPRTVSYHQTNLHANGIPIWATSFFYISFISGCKNNQLTVSNLNIFFLILDTWFLTWISCWKRDFPTLLLKRQNFQFTIHRTVSCHASDTWVIPDENCEKCLCLLSFLTDGLFTGQEGRVRRFYPGGDLMDFLHPVHNSDADLQSTNTQRSSLAVRWLTLTDRTSLLTQLSGSYMLTKVRCALHRSIFSTMISDSVVWVSYFGAIWR